MRRRVYKVEGVAYLQLKTVMGTKNRKNKYVKANEGGREGGGGGGMENLKKLVGEKKKKKKKLERCLLTYHCLSYNKDQIY
jgi:molybdenum-dependent DNA-binding transcriptional regulator ModE